MAIKKGNFLSGTIGAIVLKVVQGRQIVSSKPAKGKQKQSEETKKSGNTFGMASTLSAKIRHSIANRLNNCFDMTMCARLTAELFGVLSVCRDKKTRLYEFQENSFSRLAGFNFNLSTRVENRISEMPAIKREQGILSVNFKKMKIPDFLKFPYRSFHCRLSVSVSLLQLAEGRVSVIAESQEISISKADEYLEALAFKFLVPDGCLYVVCLYLEYIAKGINGSRAVDHKKFNPACICAAAIAPGIYKETDDYLWEDMIKY